MISRETFPAPLRSTLVGVDLTNSSLPAVEAAHVLTPENDGVLHVVYSAPSLDAKVVQRSTKRRERKPLSNRQIVIELKHKIERHVRRVVPPSRKVHLHLKEGPPQHAIQDIAQEAAIDLIILGSHQPRHALDTLMGTTVDRVLRTTSFPSLIVNRSMPEIPRRIVVASDLSRHADHALALTASWAQKWNSEIDNDSSHRVMIELVHISAYASPGYRVVDATKGLRERIEKIEAVTSGTVPIRPRIQSAPLAPDGIRRIAEESHIDMIVVGTHGHGFIMRTLLGSVAGEIVRSVRLPIVVVPPPSRER